MRCSDVPTLPVLAFLATCEGWATWYPDATFMPTVVVAMPPGTPEKVVRAKMARLIRKGYVDGCPCGCRGDYELTAKGEALLRAS